MTGANKQRHLPRTDLKTLGTYTAVRTPAAYGTPDRLAPVHGRLAYTILPLALRRGRPHEEAASGLTSALQQMLAAQITVEAGT